VSASAYSVVLLDDVCGWEFEQYHLYLFSNLRLSLKPAFHITLLHFVAGCCGARSIPEVVGGEVASSRVSNAASKPCTPAVFGPLHFETVALRMFRGTGFSHVVAKFIREICSC